MSTNAIKSNPQTAPIDGETRFYADNGGCIVIENNGNFAYKNSSNNTTWFNSNTGGGGSFVNSDRRIKQDIKEIDISLSHSFITSLKPSTFSYKEYPNIKKIGFIAQELRDAAKTDAQKSMITEDYNKNKPDDSDPLLLICIVDLIPELVGCIKYMSLQNELVKNDFILLQNDVSLLKEQNNLLHQQNASLQTQCQSDSKRISELEEKFSLLQQQNVLSQNASLQQQNILLQFTSLQQQNILLQNELSELKTQMNLIVSKLSS